eukprot:scaffold361_cov248-Pinguiococcus_pyrenoidosus.AAC.14
MLTRLLAQLSPPWLSVAEARAFERASAGHSRRACVLAHRPRRCFRRFLDLHCSLCSSPAVAQGAELAGDEDSFRVELGLLHPRHLWSCRESPSAPRSPRSPRGGPSRWNPADCRLD